MTDGKQPVVGKVQGGRSAARAPAYRSDWTRAARSGVIRVVGLKAGVWSPPAVNPDRGNLRSRLGVGPDETVRDVVNAEPSINYYCAPAKSEPSDDAEDEP